MFEMANVFKSPIKIKVLSLYFVSINLLLIVTHFLDLKALLPYLVELSYEGFPSTYLFLKRSYS